MKNYRIIIFTVFAVIFTCFPVSLSAAHVKQVSGWVEKVALGNPPIVLQAKIDTGAKNSSLHTVEYHVFKKDDKDWISFAVVNKEGEGRRIEAPLLRYAKIKQKSNRPSRERPVIMLGMCLGNTFKEVEINLVDRSNFNYPLLVGRSFLKGNFLVDADHKYLNTPNCNM